MSKHIKIFRENESVKEALAKKQKEIQEKAKAEKEKLLAEKANKASNEEEAQVQEITNEEAEKIELEEAAKRMGVKPPTEEANAEKPAMEEEKKEEDPEEEKDKGQAPNSGNGGQTERYHWEQNLMEVTVYYYLPDGTSAKDLKIDLGIKKCKLTIKGQVVIDSEWCKSIKQEDSFWCIESDSNGKRCI